VLQPWILAGERSLLQTHIATTARGLSFGQMTSCSKGHPGSFALPKCCIPGGGTTVAAHTKFKDADVIANAIGCAPLPEILIQNFLIPWLEEGLRYAPAKTAMTEPNRIVSPSFNSASVTKSPLTCVPFAEFKSFSE
jgi:hypothetical protein